jgi:hypothetical protein
MKNTILIISGILCVGIGLPTLAQTQPQDTHVAASEPQLEPTSETPAFVPPWTAYPISIEMDLSLQDMAAIDTPASPHFNHLRYYLHLNPNWSLGISVGGRALQNATFMPPQKTSATTAATTFWSLGGRYYLPLNWGTEHPELSLSRIYLEGSAFHLTSGSKTWGILPQLGIETHWGQISTRAYTGLLVTALDNTWIIAPQLNSGFGVAFNWGASHETKWDQPPYKDIVQAQPGPLIQANVGVGMLEHSALTTWVMNSQWGIGFFYGSPFNLRLFEKAYGQRSGPQLGLKGRYYLSPVHYGSQLYLEGTSAWGAYPGAGIALGWEHRDPWGLNFDLSIGLGAQSRDDRENMRGSFTFAYSTGYAWSWPLTQKETP